MASEEQRKEVPECYVHQWGIKLYLVQIFSELTILHWQLNWLQMQIEGFFFLAHCHLIYLRLHSKLPLLNKSWTCNSRHDF